MPDDLDVVGFDFLPPSPEIFFRNIERRRCDEMIEDDVVLLAPAECSDVIQIVVIEKFARDRFRGDVRRSVNEFGRQKQT